MSTAAAYAFDAYGTLFDVHSAAERYADDIGREWVQLSETWRTKQLEYTWVLACAGQHDSFWAVTERALDYAIASTGLHIGPQLRSELLSAYRKLEAYAEVRHVISHLRGAGARTLILSNGDPDMLSDAVFSAELTDVFDAVLSVSTVGRFKPTMSVYQMACDATGLEAEEISFQSSNRWDIAGARIFGLKTVWINRTGKPDEYPAQPPDLVLEDLNGLISIV